MGSYYADTWSKIAKYLHSLTVEDFTINGEYCPSEEMHVSPSICNKFNCLLDCGGCCQNNVLIWIPGESKPDYLNEVKQVEVIVRGVKNLYDYYEDNQKDSKIKWQEGNQDKWHCRYLVIEDGKCGIHGKHPMTCRTEIMRFLDVPSWTRSKYDKKGDLLKPELIQIQEVKIGRRKLSDYKTSLISLSNLKTEGEKPNRFPGKMCHIRNAPFPRPWKMRMIDGYTSKQKKKMSIQQKEELGIKYDEIRCEIFSEPSPDGIKDSIERLQQIQLYSNYFKIETRIPCIIDWLQNASHRALEEPLVFKPGQAVVSFERRGRL